MTKYYEQPVFEKGDVLYIRFPENRAVTVKVVAVPAIKDGDFCCGCIFSRFCRKYPGNSPFARYCYTTIFRKAEENRND